MTDNKVRLARIEFRRRNNNNNCCRVFCLNRKHTWKTSVCWANRVSVCFSFEPTITAKQSVAFSKRNDKPKKFEKKTRAMISLRWLMTATGSVYIKALDKAELVSFICQRTARNDQNLAGTCHSIVTCACSIRCADEGSQPSLNTCKISPSGIRHPRSFLFLCDDSRRSTFEEREWGKYVRRRPTSVNWTIRFSIDDRREEKFHIVTMPLDICFVARKCFIHKNDDVYSIESKV